MSIRYRLAQWHKKRYFKLMSKITGATRYYMKTQLSSLYGLTVTERAEIVKAFYSGKTHADISKMYADTDSVRPS